MVKEETGVKKGMMYSDAPIKDATRFNFDAYSDVLSKIILNKENETPFSIAINGTWGRGKTTLMRTIREKLKTESGKGKNRKVKSVWFDAWKYSETDTMLAALIFEIFEEMARENGVLDKLKARIVGGKQINMSKVLSDLLATVTMSRVELDKWLEDQAYKKELSFYDLFQDYMKKILMTFVLEKDGGIYSDKDGVLVIFIDDLDRCPPKQITKVLESINLFFDQEGCFFVFGVDIALISEAIDLDYKNLEGFTGIDYVKKMIQLQFDLPAIFEQDIMQFMKNELKIEKQLTDYFKLIIAGVESNQRELKRFINSLNFMRLLGESIKIKGYKEELLIKWSILNFSSKDFIKEVNKNPELLIKMQELSRRGNNERVTYINGLSNQYKEPCKIFIEDEKILKILQKGKELFNKSNIRSYIFLSSVAPKEPEETKKMKKGQNVYLRGKNLQGTILWGANLAGENLQGVNLGGKDLHDIILRGADLRGADLRGADLRGAYLLGTDLRGTLIDEKCLKTILESKEWRAASFDANIKKELEDMTEEAVV